MEANVVLPFFTFGQSSPPWDWIPLEKQPHDLSGVLEVMVPPAPLFDMNKASNVTGAFVVDGASNSMLKPAN